METGADASYTLSLHDALPIFLIGAQRDFCRGWPNQQTLTVQGAQDRKSTRLNSSHRCISYAVFCLKKKTSPARTGVTAGQGCRNAAASLPATINAEHRISQMC